MRLLQAARTVAIDSVPEATAVNIAAGLSRLYGRLAADHALSRRDRACASGDIARADLYNSVCTIIGDRDAVFSRSRRSFGGR